MKLYRSLAGIGTLVCLFGAYQGASWERYQGIAMSLVSAVVLLRFIIMTNDYVEKDGIFEASKRFGRGEISLDEFGSQTKEILRR